MPTYAASAIIESPAASTESSAPVIAESTVATNELFHWAQMTAVRDMQQQIFRGWSEAWHSTGTSVTQSALSWPNGWLSSGTTTNSFSVTSTAGNTAIANAVWTTNAWLSGQHTNVRWSRADSRTPEQIAEEAAQAEIRRQERAIENAKVIQFKDAANARARKLLMQTLNADQKKEMDEKNMFHLTVHSQNGSMRVYRIEYGYAGNVKLLGADGQPEKRYCIHADSRLPYEDQMLAQKMLLEANEPEFIRIANMTQLRRAA